MIQILLPAAIQVQCLASMYRWNPTKWWICHEVIFFLIPSSRLNSLSSYPAYHLEGRHGCSRIMALHVKGDFNVDLCSSTNIMNDGLLVWLRRLTSPRPHPGIPAKPRQDADLGQFSMAVGLCGSIPPACS